MKWTLFSGAIYMEVNELSAKVTILLSKKKTPLKQKNIKTTKKFHVKCNNDVKHSNTISQAIYYLGFFVC